MISLKLLDILDFSQDQMNGEWEYGLCQIRFIVSFIAYSL